MPRMLTSSLLSSGPIRRGFVALAISAAALSGCKRSPSGGGPGAPTTPATEPRPVSLVGVTIRPVERTIEITGTLFGEEEVTIAAEVAGRVVEVAADLGDAVEHSSLLARIDPTDYALAVEEQRSVLLTTLAQIGLDSLPSDDVDLDALPVVARARAQADNARARLDRARKLYERTPPLISEQDFADIQTQYEVATTTVSVERLNAKSLVAEARARASSLRQAEQKLSDTRVIAPAEKPLTYRVAARLVSTGEVVNPGQAMFRLVASDRVKFRGQVPERYLRDISAGASAELMSSAFPGTYAATVARISPAIDIQTRSFEVEVEAANPQGQLKPGSFMIARMSSGTKTDAMFVPESAVLQFAGVQRVFSVRDGKVVEHRSRFGKAESGMREVLDDLKDVQAVIDRPQGLSAGMAVRITEAAAR